MFSAAILLGIIILFSQAFVFAFFDTFCFFALISSINAIFGWLVTCALHYWLAKIVTNNPKAFNMVFMIQTIAKMLLYVIFVAITLAYIQEQFFFQFLVHFFVVYIIFSTFEVSLMLKFVDKADGNKRYK